MNLSRNPPSLPSTSCFDPQKHPSLLFIRTMMKACLCQTTATARGFVVLIFWCVSIVDLTDLSACSIDSDFEIFILFSLLDLKSPFRAPPTNCAQKKRMEGQLDNHTMRKRSLQHW